jgi:hypothetical protein
MPEAPVRIVHHPVPASSGVLVWGLLSSFFGIFWLLSKFF